MDGGERTEVLIVDGYVDDPAALGYKPLLVKRLRRQRAQRQAARSARRLRG